MLIGIIILSFVIAFMATISILYCKEHTKINEENILLCILTIYLMITFLFMYHINRKDKIIIKEYINKSNSVNELKETLQEKEIIDFYNNK